MGLTKLQRKFVDGVVAGQTYTEAALNAGYSKKTANRIGSENMTKASILEAVEEKQKIQQEAVQKRIAGVVDEMLSELIQVYFDPDTSPQVKANIFKDISDRAGFKPVEKSEVDMTANVDVGEQSEVFERYLKDVDIDE